MNAKDFIKTGKVLIEQGQMLIAYGEHLNTIKGGKPKVKKFDHRTKEYMDNLKREFLLDHNEKLKKKRDTENRKK